jgi:hypothetical protein
VYRTGDGVWWYRESLQYHQSEQHLPSSLPPHTCPRTVVGICLVFRHVCRGWCVSLKYCSLGPRNVPNGKWNIYCLRVNSKWGISLNEFTQEDPKTDPTHRYRSGSWGRSFCGHFSICIIPLLSSCQDFSFSFLTSSFLFSQEGSRPQ